jgi:hypothetical protein
MRYLLATPLLMFTLPALGGQDSEAFTVTAVGHDSRIDLSWEPAEGSDRRGYFVYRSASPDGPFLRLHPAPHETPVYSDFIGVNGKTFHYRVGKASMRPAEVEERSAIVSACTKRMSDEDLLSSVQEATLRYFWDYAHPVSGMAYERGRTGRLPRPGRRVPCATGGTGFGLMAIMIGAERGFLPRDRAADRVLKIVTFLQDRADRFHGVWPHWMDGATGETIPFSANDDGADLVETSFLIQGMLTVRSYFDRDQRTESEIRRRITQLWHEVEWDFFLQQPDSKRLTWHWSPRHGWKMNLGIVGYNECMITYLLAIASPTHAIPADCYYEGWAANPRYVNGETYFGHKQFVGVRMGGPIFWTHYSFLGFDPRGKQDRFCNYYENSRNIARIHRAYCIQNPDGHAGYSELVWGLTASDVPDGYRANAPGRDDGTIAPTAAISCMPYTPDESLAALKHLYREYGDRLWGEFGFRDAFNLDRNWFADSYIAIDQGPIICMIENHRTQLCWRMFMANPEIAPMLHAIGWREAVNASP